MKNSQYRIEYYPDLKYFAFSLIEIVRDDVIDRNDDDDDEFKIHSKDLEAEDPDDFGEDEEEIDPNR